MAQGWRSLKRLRFYQVLGSSYALVIVYLTLTSNPPAGPDVAYADKWGHLTAYGTLMLWWCQLAEARTLRLRFWAAFVLMGGVMELLQGWGGVRHAEWGDFIANGLGATLGLLITRGRAGLGLQWLERKLS